MDGFGRRDHSLTLDDELWGESLATDRVIEGLMRGRDLPINEERFMDLLRVAVVDQHKFDKEMSSATRALRYSSAIGVRLWTMLEEERQKVGGSRPLRF